MSASRKPWVVTSEEFPRLRTDLRLIDSSLQLCFNFMRARYEVWGERGLVLRICDTNDDFAPPGPWVIEVVRGNPSYRPRPDPLSRADDHAQEALRCEELAKRRRDAVQTAMTLRV